MNRFKFADDVKLAKRVYPKQKKGRKAIPEYYEEAGVAWGGGAWPEEAGTQAIHNQYDDGQELGPGHHEPELEDQVRQLTGNREFLRESDVHNLLQQIDRRISLRRDGNRWFLHINASYQRAGRRICRIGGGNTFNYLSIFTETGYIERGILAGIAMCQTALGGSN